MDLIKRDERRSRKIAGDKDLNLARKKIVFGSYGAFRCRRFGRSDSRGEVDFLRYTPLIERKENRSPVQISSLRIKGNVYATIRENAACSDRYCFVKQCHKAFAITSLLV